jgi:hypothetical protein
VGEYRDDSYTDQLEDEVYKTSCLSTQRVIDITKRKASPLSHKKSKNHKRNNTVAYQDAQQADEKGSNSDLLVDLNISDSDGMLEQGRKLLKYSPIKSMIKMFPQD